MNAKELRLRTQENNIKVSTFIDVCIPLRKNQESKNTCHNYSTYQLTHRHLKPIKHIFWFNSYS